MANSRKKVIVRTIANELHSGYLPGSGLLDAEGRVALLDLEARIVALEAETIRWIAWVRDFNLGDLKDPERLSRKTFLARPRAEGLWVRLKIVGGETFEGLAPLDVSLLDGVRDDGGIYLTPPDIRSNTQRVFVPRTAIENLRLLAVITTPSRVAPGSEPGSGQSNLFP